MIFDARTLPMPLEIEADLCVVGSGAGGSGVAMTAAEAGLKVVVLEAGGWFPPNVMNQREEQMLPHLFWDAGARTNAERTVKIHQGRGVGGSTLHNINLCKRIPEVLLRNWQQERGLRHLSLQTWAELYQEVEGLLSVSQVPAELRNRHNRLLEEGCRQLGWQGGPLQHNRTGCVGSGFCELGCAFDAKNNALKVMVPRAVKAGAQFITHVQAVTVTHEGGRVTGVEAVLVQPPSYDARGGRVVVRAPRVCLSASATATAALLQRSRVPAPQGSTGHTLRIHPAVVAAGDFAEPVNAWQGVPQTYECTQWLDFDGPGHRLWIVPAFAHPVGTATMVPGLGVDHQALMERYAHLAVFTAMLHDQTAGRVEPFGDTGLSIDYTLDDADVGELGLGLWACASLLLAAGARRVLIPSHPQPVVVQSQADLEALRSYKLVPGTMDVVAVHPMGSVPMGDDPAVAAVDSRGQHHHMQGLYVADGSLFPSSIGVPPQLSIYAMGLHVGRALVGAA